MHTGLILPTPALPLTKAKLLQAGAQTLPKGSRGSALCCSRLARGRSQGTSQMALIRANPLETSPRVPYAAPHAHPTESCPQVWCSRISGAISPDPSRKAAAPGPTTVARQRRRQKCH